MATTSTIQSDIRSALHATNIIISKPSVILSRATSSSARWSFFPRPLISSHYRISTPESFRVRAFSTESTEPVIKVPDKPPICTADELHYVSVSNTDWRLALWRYHPSPQAPPRNHPLLLLSGVGTNAVGYDLSPGSSFARYMSGQGFETWILEVRGAGLSIQGSTPKDVHQSAHEVSEEMEAVAKSVTNGTLSVDQQPSNVPSPTLDSRVSFVEEDSHLAGIVSVWDESKLVTKLTEIFMRLSERLSGFLSESELKIMFAELVDQISKLLVDSQLSERMNEIRGKLLSLLEARQNSAIAGQFRDLSQGLVNVIEEGQKSVSPQLFDLQERLSSIIEDFQKQLDLIVKYDWDFDNYLEEDVPAAMEYIRAQTKPKDGKLLAIGHSMGGILLYAMLSRCSYEGRDSGLAAIGTLASSLNYTPSKSRLKLLLPLADPAQALNVPVVPLGAMLSAAYPLSTRPPYVLSWLNDLISAQDMMHPELLEKLVLNNFCTIPAKLILQLTTAFRNGGLCDRSGKFFYQDHLHKNKVPVLAIAGDRDLICPPEAVEETVKLIPEHLATYKVFGEPGGPHYAHYDLVGGRLAVEQVYPCIVEFLSRYDLTGVSSK
uniref:AB hydrolase-1 domain-containing protein n=1 Tax=Populus davidiana TaxID=266767 RepID=A0A6M2ECY8_9ROSI